MFVPLKKLWASVSNIPDMRSIPTDRYGYNPLDKNQPKSTLPRNPTYFILRNFAKNPVVNRPILAVQDRISGLDYEIRPKVAGRKYTKQIRTVRNIIDNPNIDQTRRQFEAMLLNDLLTLDAGVFEVCRSKNQNHPIYLYPIDGATIQHVVPVDYTNPLAYKYMQTNEKGNIFFRRNEMCFIRRDCFTDRPYGLAPVVKAYDYIRFFLDGGDGGADNVNTKTAGMAINLGENASKDEVEAFRKYFTQEIEGTGHIPIVGGAKGFDTKQIRSFTEDGLYLSWLKWLMTVIANAYPFPVQLLGLDISSDRSTTEDLETRIIEELVKPYARLLENAYQTHVINMLGYGDILEFRYIFEDSESMKTQKWNRLNSAFTTGWLTENEVRKEIGFDESTSEYANYTSDERKARINKDLGVNGFNGLGDVKDTSDAKDKKPKEGGGGSG